MEKLKRLLVAGCVALAACQTRESADVYNKQEAGREQLVRYATVDSVRKVTIQGSQTGVGAIAGGVTGAVAGSGVGQGRGAATAAVLGGVAGGVIGASVEEKATRQDAAEITVRLDSGELRAIVQEVQQADQEFRPGQRVRLLTSGGMTRVLPE